MITTKSSGLEIIVFSVGSQWVLSEYEYSGYSDKYDSEHSGGSQVGTSPRTLTT